VISKEFYDIAEGFLLHSQENRRTRDNSKQTPQNVSRTKSLVHAILALIKNT